jgi:hypothetical protein
MKAIVVGVDIAKRVFQLLSISVLSVVYFNKDVADWCATHQVRALRLGRRSCDRGLFWDQACRLRRASTGSREKVLSNNALARSRLATAAVDTFPT